MGKYIETFNERMMNENIEVVDQENIEICEFDNELSDRENWDLDRYSFSRNFDKSQVNKLNSFFGVYKTILKNYTFELNIGGFGREKINFNGVINKKSEYDNNGEKSSKEFYYMIDGYIKVKLGDHIGNRSIHLKLETFRDVIIFLESFESKIQINF